MKDISLKFKLPVGAHLAGLRHLGNGEFVGKVLEPSILRQKVPMLLEGTCHPEEKLDELYRLEVCEDPLGANLNLNRCIILGEIYHDDKKITEQELAQMVYENRYPASSKTEQV